MREVLRTLSEIRATATKATRGAGYDWGTAEEAGVAVRILESHGLPGVSVLAHVLSCSPGCESKLGEGGQNGLRAMVSLSDRLPFPEEAIPAGPVTGPLMLAAPLIPFAREQAVAFTLRWDGAVLHCTPGGILAKGDLRAEVAAGVTLDSAPVSLIAQRGPDWRSRLVAAADWNCLDSLAARTLVPETAASRARGAGPADAVAD